MHNDNPLDDIAFIRGVIAQARRSTQASGSFFILWGVVISAGLLATWAAMQGMLPAKAGLYWLVVLLVGIAGTAWLMRSEAAREICSQDGGGRLIGQVWLACGVAFVLLLLVGNSTGAIDGSASPGIAAAITGVGVYLTATLSQLNWFRLTAVAWWVASLVMLVWRGSWTLALFAVLLLFLYVVPGIVLNAQRHKTPEQVVE